MLLSFSVENFRSFRDRVELRMDASTDTELKEVVRHGIAGVPDSFHGILPVVSIHGANASGKSNFVKAAEFLDLLVDWTESVRIGMGRDVETVPPLSSASSFRLDEIKSCSPTSLEVVFILENVRWAYGLVVDNSRIHGEWLYYWPRGKRTELFARGCAVSPNRSAWIFDRIVQRFGRVRRNPSQSDANEATAVQAAESSRWTQETVEESTEFREAWTWGPDFEKGISEGQALAGRTRTDVPFLSVAATWNHPQAAQVLRWFSRLSVIDATLAQTLALEQGICRACEEDAALLEWVQNWLKAADLGISSIEIEKVDIPTDGGGREHVRQRYQPKAIHKTTGGGKVAFDMRQESHGTNRIFGLAHTFYQTLQHGGVLIADELHAGLHPLLLRALVKIFQSPKRNPHHAQLIFTTHDVSVLDNSLLRRDQIHIVEKNQAGASSLYSLSDFDEKPRKDSPLIKYYLSGNLGGVPDLNLDLAFPLKDGAGSKP